MPDGAMTFEDLWIWQQAQLLANSVYPDFGDQSHAGRDYGFRNQIQWAAVPVMNNIAEGFERSSSPDLARFLDMAKGSCGEVRDMYYLAEDVHDVSSQIAMERRESCRKIAAGVSSLATHLRN